MNVQAVKKKIINAVTHTDSEDLLERIAALIQKDNEGNTFWASLTPEQREQLEADIEEGNRQLEAGEGIPHEEVIKTLKRWPTK